MMRLLILLAVSVAVALACRSDKDCEHHHACQDGQEAFCDQSTMHCHCRDAHKRDSATCTDDDLSACSCEHGGVPVCMHGHCHCDHHHTLQF